MRNKKIIEMIKSYQNDRGYNRAKRCRFIPTCSEYAKICYMNYSFIKASFLATKRFLKCNPFHKIAYDPVILKGDNLNLEGIDLNDVIIKNNKPKGENND